MNYRLLNWLKDGKYRVETLKILSERVYLSSELANKLDINRASMSRILRALKEKNLVDSVSENSRTVSYILTKEGKKALEDLKKNGQ